MVARKKKTQHPLFVPRHYGWARQPFDARDHVFAAPAPAKFAPTIDNTAGMGPQLDQGDLGSCGLNTGSEMITFDQKAEGRKLIAASRLFMYYCCRVAMGQQYVNQDSGVDNRTLLKSLNKTGYCPESLWPYNTAKFTTKPTAACYTAALANLITNYAAVAQTQNAMLATLAAKKPFMFGFDCFPGLESEATARTGIVPMPKKGETTIGGHDVTFCGFTTVKLPGIVKGNFWPANTFRFRNHWLNADGTPWGDGGYGYMPLAYALDPNRAGDFWVINYAN